MQIILEFPQVLCYSVDERLHPFFDFLTSSLELDKSSLIAMIKHRPGLLGLNQKSVSQLVDYLKSVGSSRDEIIHFLQTSL